METVLDFPLIKVESKGFSEEEYIKMFYGELTLLRVKYRKINPILQIQRVYRGWRVRSKLRKNKEKVDI